MHEYGDGNSKDHRQYGYSLSCRICNLGRHLQLTLSSCSRQRCRDALCRLEIKTLHIKINELLRQIMLAHAEGNYPRLVARFSKISLLVIDEWLRNPLTTEQAREVLDLIDERYQKLSTIFCSQLPVKSWHQAIKDPTAADAILDRIVHNSHRIELSGESLRKGKRGETSLRAD